MSESRRKGPRREAVTSTPDARAERWLENLLQRGERSSCEELERASGRNEPAANFTRQRTRSRVTN
jgi:hypothetical protein